MKRKNKTSAVSLLLFVTGLLLLGAALLYRPEKKTENVKENPVITFALCGDVELQKIVSNVVGVFSRAYNCDVEVYCFSTGEELREKVLSQFAAGKPYDVFYLDEKTCGVLVNTEHLQSLNGIVEKRHVEGDDFYSAALSCGNINGTQYALPTGVMPYLLCYNRTVFQEAEVKDPQDYLDEKQWTAQGMVDCLSALYEKTKEPVIALNSTITRNQAVPGNLFEITGAQPAALHTNNAEMTVRMSETVMQEAFVAGRIPVIVSDLTMTRLGTKMDWDVVPFPSENSDFTRCRFEVPMIAAANGNNAELAEQFINFYVSGIGQKLRLEQGECLIPSLNMTFYSSMGNTVFPNHSNYYFFAIEYGNKVS